MAEEMKSGLITIPKALMKRLDSEAAAQKRSRSSQIEIILKERYDAGNGGDGKKPNGAGPRGK